MICSSDQIVLKSSFYYRHSDNPAKKKIKIGDYNALYPSICHPQQVKFVIERVESEGRKAWVGLIRLYGIAIKQTENQRLGTRQSGPWTS
jgi:hypothetical protein